MVMLSCTMLEGDPIGYGGCIYIYIYTHLERRKEGEIRIVNEKKGRKGTHG